jgi:hypothetical protein
MNAMLKPLFICSGLYLYNYWILLGDILTIVNEEDKAVVTSWAELGNTLMK